MARPITQAILRKVNQFIEELPGELSTMDQVRAEQARQLARQLDAAGPGGSGAVAQALPAINRELSQLLERLLSGHSEDDPFLDYLLVR